LYANSNLDGEDSPRTKALEEVEHAYEELISQAWNGTERAVHEEDEQEPDFIAAGRRSIAGMTRPPILPGEEQIAALPSG
jgi:hypothetical protein